MLLSEEFKCAIDAELERQFGDRLKAYINSDEFNSIVDTALQKELNETIVFFSYKNEFETLRLSIAYGGGDVSSYIDLEEVLREAFDFYDDPIEREEELIHILRRLEAMSASIRAEIGI